MTSKDISKSLSMLRSQAMEAIGDILDNQEAPEMDLYDCGLLTSVSTANDTIESREIIGISRDEDDEEIYVHLKTTDIADTDDYSSIYIGELGLYELIEILRVMEDINNE